MSYVWVSGARRSLYARPRNKIGRRKHAKIHSSQQLDVYGEACCLIGSPSNFTQSEDLMTSVVLGLAFLKQCKWFQLTVASDIYISVVLLYSIWDSKPAKIRLPNITTYAFWLSKVDDMTTAICTSHPDSRQGCCQNNTVGQYSLVSVLCSYAQKTLSVDGIRGGTFSL